MVTSDLPPYAFGGVGSFVYELTNQLKKEDIELTIISGSNGPSTLSREGNVTNVQVHVYQAPPRDVWFQLKSYKIIESFAKNVDVIHLQSLSSSLFIDKIRKSSGKPILLTNHGEPLHCFRETLRPNLDSLTLDEFRTYTLSLPIYMAFNVLDMLRTDCIVAVANHLLEDLKKLYGHSIMRKGIVIPNGLDVEKLTPRNGSSPIRGEKRIAFVGRLLRLKGIMYLLDAFLILSKRQCNANVTLDIYGRGPLEKKVRQYIEKNGLVRQANVHGKIPREDLLKELANSTLFVLPSSYEACPVSLLEAMALEKPVITSDKPWSREFVEDGINGFRVDVEDPIHFADIIENTVSDRDLREKLGGNARHTVVMKYAIQDIARQYLQVYKKLS